MKIKIKGQFAQISIDVEGSLVLANREMVKALIENLKENLVDLEKELCKNISNSHIDSN